MRRKSALLLFGILILGFIIRFNKISAQPLYGDELTMVYDSYSLLKTGTDQTGQAFPLTFKMGAGRPPGYVYFSIPFVAMFGPSALGVRGLSIFSGLGIIILMYFLGRKLFNERVGLIASFLTSISLWDIYLSRAGFEAHFGLFLALFGIVMFLYKKYIPMAFAWGLAIFTYPTFKLTLPLLFAVLLIFKGFKKVLKSKIFIASLVILVVFGGLSIGETFKGTSEERFLRLNIFSTPELQEEIIQKVNQDRYLSTLPGSIKPIVFNKPLEYSRILFEGYMENISPDFLYIRGDRNPRHNPGELGMLYLIELPLLFIGLHYLSKNKKKILQLLIAWILIVPLATMFMGQTHGLRNALMLPPFILIFAYTLSKFSQKKLWFVGSLVGIQLLFVLATVYFLAPDKHSNFWSKEAREVSLTAISEKENYEKIILSTKIDNIEYAYPVYAKVDPKEVISQYGKFPKVYGNVVITDQVDIFKKNDKTFIMK